MLTDALDHVFRLEGGFVDDPADSGGATRWGITEALARAYGYEGPMSELPKATAVHIYRNEFWEPLHLDEIVAISGQELANELFEQAVNLGRKRPGLSLQEWLNALNQREAAYDDIAEDGVVGPGTLGALKAFVRERGSEGVSVLTTALNCDQGHFYKALVQQRHKDERFVFGWMLNRVHN